MRTCPKYGIASTLITVSALCFSAGAGAIEPIPEETGWSGFALFGAGFTDVKSNTVVGNSIIDVGDDTISSILQSPQSDDTVHPVIGLELKYTLPGRSQIFLGSSLEDRLAMDFMNQLGWRKQTEFAGTFQLGLLINEPAIEVWKDPYLTGEPRTEVDRDSEGFRFEWDSVFGSGFGFLVQTRDIEIDDELSGTDPALDCDAACQLLLDRNGDQQMAKLWYRFMLSPSFILEPRVRFYDDDRDGAAIAADAWVAELGFTSIQHPWIVTGTVLVGQSEHDEANPLYGIRQDSDVMAVDATVLYALPTRSGRWQLSASVFWGESDSDVTFHDNELTQATIGFIYNFGGSGK